MVVDRAEVRPERPVGGASVSKRTLLWVDGVNSAVAGWLVLQSRPDAIPVHCDLGESVHPDSRRFIDDVARWYGKPVERIRSAEYATVDEVIEHRGYLSGPRGAPCTGALKIVPRMNFQFPSDTHVWGYTADKPDAKRFAGMLRRFPELRQAAPLIDAGMTKRDTHDFLRRAGVRRPLVYDLGMPNGNCLGCVKAQSPAYWALMREHFPEVFWRRDAQCRRFNARIVILREVKDAKGRRRNIRGFPSDVPEGHTTRIRGQIGGCGFHCEASA